MPSTGGGGVTNVASSQITDDTIVNADVNSAANIDASKLNLANQIDNAEIADDVVSVATVSLTATEIKALHTTPKQILAAPAAGLLHVIEYVIYSFTVGTQYTGGSPIYLIYGTDNNALTSQYDNSIINAAASSVNFRDHGAAGGAFNVVLTQGTAQAVNLRLENAIAFVTGTGTLKVFVKYRTITL